jgi:hypothetical protein
MAKRKAVAPVSLGDDILDPLRDLHKQATVERSHYYTGRCISDAINEITALRKQVSCSSPQPARAGMEPSRMSKTRSRSNSP